MQLEPLRRSRVWQGYSITKELLEPASRACTSQEAHPSRRDRPSRSGPANLKVAGSNGYVCSLRHRSRSKAIPRLIDCNDDAFNIQNSVSAGKESSTHEGLLAPCIGLPRTIFPWLFNRGQYGPGSRFWAPSRRKCLQHAMPKPIGLRRFGWMIDARSREARAGRIERSLRIASPPLRDRPVDKGGRAARGTIPRASPSPNRRSASGRKMGKCSAS